jgi:hypothetical protein
VLSFVLTSVLSLCHSCFALPLAPAGLMIATQRLLLMGAVAVCPAILGCMDAVVHLITCKGSRHHAMAASAHPAFARPQHR